MNLYRVFRLGPVNDLPAGTVLEAVVVAPDEGWARGVVAVEEDDQAVAHQWLNIDKTRCTELGAALPEYLDDQVDGYNVPHTVMVNRKHSLHGQSDA